MGGAILTPMNCFYYWGFLVCASFGENQSRNATMRVPTDGYRQQIKRGPCNFLKQFLIVIRAGRNSLYLIQLDILHNTEHLIKWVCRKCCL